MITIGYSLVGKNHFFDKNMTKNIENMTNMTKKEI